MHCPDQRDAALADLILGLSETEYRTRASIVVHCSVAEMEQLQSRLSAPSPDESDVEAEKDDSPLELVEARAQRDLWKHHSESRTATNYAREQHRVWARRVEEIEQSLRPLPITNMVELKPKSAVRSRRKRRAVA
jgi:hypothetical protein